MKNTFAKMFTVCALAGVLGVAFTGCDDSSSASSNETEASSSSVVSSDNEVKSSSSTKENKDSSDSKSSSSVKVSALSSSSVALATPCKTETEDSCEYGTLNDERDGQIYKTVKIGNQWWMAENLNYEYKVNDSTYGSYCYNNSADSCAKYGRLYTWAAAMDSTTTGCGYGKSCTATHPVQGICPSGWHLPDTVDWHDLIVAAGGKYSAGAKLKSTSGWENDRWGNDGNGTDAFGFSALPSGYMSRSGDYHTAGGYAYIWSSFEYITGLVAYEMGLRCDVADAYVERGSEDSGYAVRCIKDSD